MPGPTADSLLWPLRTWNAGRAGASTSARALRAGRQGAAGSMSPSASLHPLLCHSTETPPPPTPLIQWEVFTTTTSSSVYIAPYSVQSSHIYPVSHTNPRKNDELHCIDKETETQIIKAAFERPLRSQWQMQDLNQPLLPPEA